MYNFFTGKICRPQGYAKKIKLIMKITTTLFFISLMHAGASVFPQKITYRAANVPLSQFFTEIYKQTGYTVAWAPEKASRFSLITLNLDKTPLKQALESSLDGLSLDFTIGKNVVIIKKRDEKIAVERKIGDNLADEITVTGTIRDAKGSLLPGVNVSVTGTKLGTVTDNNGNFVLTVSEGSILRVTSIGFIGQSIKVTKENKTLKIILEEDVKQADEIVVTAFGRRERKEAVVGSVTSVKPADMKIPASNLTTALAGQAAGIIAYQPTGQPGQDNAQFFIRGVTTFGYKVDPLILIDNIELNTNDLARINVDDIASFSILKDASATALYGARGANGVILVSTKEGKVGKMTINGRIESSISQNTQSLELADPITYINLFNEATLTRNPTQPLPFNQDKINNTINTINKSPGYNPYVYPAVDWLSTLIKERTNTQRANVSVSGGGPLARYYVAGAYNLDHGNLRDDPMNNNSNNIRFENYQLRSNVNLTLTKTTEAILRFSGTYSAYKGPLTADGSFNSDIYNMALHTSPVLFPAFYPADAANAGTKHILFGAPPGTFGSTPFNNPYALLRRGHKTSTESRVLAQVEVNQKLDFIASGLNFHGIFETNRYSYFDSNLSYKPFYYNIGSYDRASDTYSLNWLNQKQGDAIEYLEYFPGSPIINTNTYIQANIDYNKQFGNHTLAGTLVLTQQQSTYSNASKLVDALPHRNLGMAGRLGYNYEGKYFAEINFGYNGSERFSEEHRFGFFPTIGGGWLISGEKFFTPLSKIINRMKLRSSYGLVGNDAISDRRFFYSSDVNLNGGGGAEFGTNRGYSRNGVAINNYPDPEVTWETSRQFNLALEITTLKNLNIIAEYYNYNRYNILQKRAYIPTTSGLEADIFANLGKANSRGVDLSMDYKTQLTSNLLVSGRGNLTLATDKYTYFEEPDYPEPWRKTIGHPIRSGFGYVAERLFVDDVEAQSSPTQVFSATGKSPRGGDIKYRDLNGDGIINERDQTFIGYPQVPQVVYGYGLSVQYKNFDVSAFFQGQARVSFFIDPNRVSPFVQSNQEYIYGNTQLLKAFAENHWSENNQEIYATYPRLGVNRNDIENNLQPSTWWLRNGSFLRLKSAEIGYSMPQSLTKKLGIQKCRIYANGLNLLTWSDFDLWDPELGGNGFAYPIQKVFNLGININL